MYSQPLGNHVRFYLGQILQGQIKADQHKSAPILLIIGSRGCNVLSTCRKLFAENLLVVSPLTLNHFFKVKQWQLNIKVHVTLATPSNIKV